MMSPALRAMLPTWFDAFAAGTHAQERAAQKTWDKAASGQAVDEKNLRDAMRILGKTVDDLANALANRAQRSEWRKLVDEIPALEAQQTEIDAQALEKRKELTEHIRQTEAEIAAILAASSELSEPIRLAREAAAKLREGRPNPRVNELIEQMHRATEQLRMHRAAVEQGMASFEALRGARQRERTCRQTGNLIAASYEAQAIQHAETLELSARINKSKIKNLEKEIAEAAKELAEIERVQLEP